MRDVVWAFRPKHHSTREAFAEAVRAYHLRIVKDDARWRPDERVLDASRVVVHFEYAGEVAYDEDSVTLTSGEPSGFTAAELLWRLHEHLADRDLADHCFFEGFVVERDGEVPELRVRQGS